MNSADFKPRIKLSYPEFYNHYFINEALGWSLAYAFDNIDGITWYNQFVDQLFEAKANKRYFPIYRMGDGEFSFLLQKNIYDIIPFRKLNWKQKILRVRRRLKKQPMGHISGLNRDGVEQYTQEEVRNLYTSFLLNLKFISENGILALGFDTGNFYGKFVPYVYDSLKKNKITLNSKNYYHVYHVYALFSSSQGKELLNNQNVLVITSLNNEKISCFNKELNKMGVKRVDYYSISSSKAMMEVIDLSKIPIDIDLILIGAGVGSANIIRQLYEVDVPCIDVGAILGNFIEPARKWDRPYMISDKDFDLNSIKFLSEKQKVIVKKFINRSIDKYK